MWCSPWWQFSSPLPFLHPQDRGLDFFPCSSLRLLALTYSQPDVPGVHRQQICGKHKEVIGRHEWQSMEVVIHQATESNLKSHLPLSSTRMLCWSRELPPQTYLLHMGLDKPTIWWPGGRWQVQWGRGAPTPVSHGEGRGSESQTTTDPRPHGDSLPHTAPPCSFFALCSWLFNFWTPGQPFKCLYVPGIAGTYVALNVIQDTLPPPHLVEGTQKSPKDEGDLIISIMKLWGSWCHFDLPQTLDLIMISQINIWLIVSLHNSITRIPVAGSIWTRLPVFSHLTILTGSEVVPIRYWFPRGNFLLILHTELEAFRHMQILRIYFFSPEAIFCFFVLLWNFRVLIILGWGNYPPHTLFTLRSSVILS